MMELWRKITTKYPEYRFGYIADYDGTQLSVFDKHTSRAKVATITSVNTQDCANTWIALIRELRGT